MGNILRNLSDGSWWFSVVFLGVFMSALAGLLKDQLECWLLSVSAALDDQRRAHERLRRQLIDSLLTDARYFELARFRATIACVIFAASIMLHFCAPMMLALQPANFVPSSVVWGVIAPGLAVSSMAMAYCAARRVELINAVTTELRLRQRLPKLP
jgi:hypothetical protein